MSERNNSNLQQPALKYHRCKNRNGRSDKTEEVENCGRQNLSWFTQYAQSSSTWLYLKDMLTRVVSSHQANNNEAMLGANLEVNSEGWQKFNNASSHSTTEKGTGGDVVGSFPNTNVETTLPPLSELSLCTISCSQLPKKFVKGGSNKHFCVMEDSSNLNVQQPEDDTMLGASENDVMIHEKSNSTIVDSDKKIQRDDSLSLWDLRKSIEATIIPQSSFDAISESQGNSKNVSKRKMFQAFYSTDETSIRHGRSGDRLNRSKEKNSSEDMDEPTENVNFEPPDSHLGLRKEEGCNLTGQISENTSLLQNKARDKRYKFAKRTQHSLRNYKKSSADKEPSNEKFTENSASCKTASEFESRSLVLNRRTRLDHDRDFGMNKTEIAHAAEPANIRTISDEHPNRKQNDSTILADSNIKTEIPTTFGFYFAENSSNDRENQQLLITTANSVQHESDDSVAPDTGESSETYCSSTTCSISPVSFVSDTSQKIENGNYAEDTTSSDSLTSTTNIKTGGTMRSLARIFRRSSSKQYMPPASYCGYSLDRDYCVDQETDKIFKSFLKQDGGVSPNIGTTSTRNRQLHFSGRSAITQLRRQVMRKQYSDSIAMYYGQRMRRMRVEKQRSDSVNCPVDRAVLRRQDKIEEEFDPEEINESLTSPGGGSRRGSGRSPLTVTELKEWRRSQD